DVVPMARELRQRPSPVPVRNTNEWRNYMLASCFGAVMGIGGYTYLTQGGLPKEQAAKPPAPPTAVATAAGQQPRVPPEDAFRERVSNQLFRADAPSAGAGYATPMYRSEIPGMGLGFAATAQSPGDALLQRASAQLPPRDAPVAQAPIPVP